MASALDDRVPHIERLVDAIDLPIGRWDSDARLLSVSYTHLTLPTKRIV